ncbi:MAG: DNA topoisomerase IV subunit A [Victivallales bacterium]|nr:DNA topoisomerase IV subunit A [Victivallales bacterium]
MADDTQKHPEDELNAEIGDEAIVENAPDVELPQNDGGDQLRNFFDDCFIQYASYVVRDRAIPDVDDGLKPVQRRILHCMHQTDDGRFNKVAGVVGDTMHYHPHGDASIYGALVVLENKHYYIEGQGNFGNILTGMGAAAPRYIECRLSQLAKETLFNPEITDFVDTYDGRLQEPVRLPAKVPSLLMLGSDGIAVGMSTQIFPCNFVELLQAEIAILRGESFQIYPDFPQGALMDVSEFDDGAGRVRVRARIEPDGDKKVIIREIPPGTTTDSLIASIEDAAKRNKIKIAGVHDYTAEHINIEISLQRGIYAEETIKELYAYTSCEQALTSNILVIVDNMPTVMTVSQVLHRNVEKLQEYLKRELELKIHKLEEKIFAKTLVQIFIENKIYKKIETAKTLEQIFTHVRNGLEKFRAQLYRDITDDDIDMLLQIPIRRISAFDIQRNQDELAALDKDLAQVRDDLDHLVNFTIRYLQALLDKYGDEFPRRTEITQFETVNVREVARRDVKVYHDKQTHFIGTNVKSSSKEGEPIVLTEFDHLTLLKTDGTCKVIDIPEKEYIGVTKYVFATNKEQVYSILYRDKIAGTWYVKRFKLGQFILNREYHVIPENCVIEELYTNTGVVLSMEITSFHRRSSKTVSIAFAQYPLRSREAKGFKITSFQVENIRVLEKGRPFDGTPEPEADEASEPTTTTTASPADPATPAPAEPAAPASSEPREGMLFADSELPPPTPIPSPPPHRTPKQPPTSQHPLSQGSFFFDDENDAH